MAPGLKETYLYYLGWTDLFIQFKETVHQFVASSHKWTHRPLTLNKTQMKTPLLFCPRLLEADIFLHSEPSGSWRSLRFSSLFSCKARTLGFLPLRSTPSQNQKDLPAWTEQRSSGAPAPASEESEWSWSLSCPALGLGSGTLVLLQSLRDAIIYRLAGWATHPHPSQPNVATELVKSLENTYRTQLLSGPKFIYLASIFSVSCQFELGSFCELEKRKECVFFFSNFYDHIQDLLIRWSQNTLMLSKGKSFWQVNWLNGERWIYELRSCIR